MLYNSSIIVLKYCVHVSVYFSTSMNKKSFTKNPFLANAGNKKPTSSFDRKSSQSGKSVRHTSQVYKTKETKETNNERQVGKVDKHTKTHEDTSWGSVASWYNEHLEKTGDTYHEKVVYPNLSRVLSDIKGKRILDLACGQGQFSRLIRDQGAFVTGIDLGKELIAIAESHNPSVKEIGTHKIIYHHGSADNLAMIKDATCDIVVCILALQNIENLQKTIDEVYRILAPTGRFVFVINHPSFRNPRKTRWDYDDKEGVQYRRVDEYMSESHVKIDMTPGSKSNKKFTTSFHRPLQIYIKALSKYNFAVTRLEEWVSHRDSEKGPRQKSENNARKEIPLFMCIEAKKMSN